jgi:squalene-hopene/tetraprenyl-beta-curcumene cyclase
MKTAKQSLWAFCTTVGVLSLSSGCSQPASHNAAPDAASWSPQAAAVYLDQRESEWEAWPVAARDHGTFCVSCHTAMPYALSRPALRAELGQERLSVDESELLENVTKRVRLWKDVGPYYGGNVLKKAQSRGSEAVLNALILASYDAQNEKLSPDTRLAFDNMWALQEISGAGKGSWPWLQFNLEPWEGRYSRYYGAALAAVAVGTAPQSYRLAPEIQHNLKLLQDYLNRAYSSQPVVNRVALLYADAKMPGLIEPERRASIIKEVLGKQQTDGGWSLSSLVVATELDWVKGQWKRAEGIRSTKSDGYATGFVAFALEQAGMPNEDIHLQSALSWLTRNQKGSDGSWQASSVNESFALNSTVGHFMSDAATAYAVLALTKQSANRPQSVVAIRRPQ